MLIAGAAILYYFLKNRNIVADKNLDTLSLCPWLKRAPRGKILTKLSDIQALQICSICSIFPSGNSAYAGVMYEINAITNHNDNQRINLTCHRKYDPTYSAAVTFAEFLGVPLLDHTHLNQESVHQE